MNDIHASVLAQVVHQIRSTIDEDWIQSVAIGPGTRFNDDLELESIEFMKITDALQQHYGAGLDMVGWLSDKTVHELIRLSVGDLASYIATALERR